MRKSAGILSLAFIGITLYTPIAAAQPTTTPGSGQALEIGPPVINLTADPGQSIKTQLSLRDVSRDRIIVSGVVNDFQAGGEDGTPKLLLEANEEPSPYSIKTWVPALPELSLEPRQVKELPVTINVPADAAPGGYYGVIRFTTRAPELNGAAGVSLAASLGALVFIKVNGQAKEDIKFVEFFASKNEDKAKKSSIFDSAPLKFTQRVKNDGNIHDQPTGRVTVKDMFGKTVGATNINLPPRNVLPGSIRKFEQPFGKSIIGNKKLFGKYTATAEIKYGEEKKKIITETLTFWVIPWKMILGILIVLIGGFFALRYALKRYNRTVIKKAYSGGKRK